MPTRQERDELKGIFAIVRRTVPAQFTNKSLQAWWSSRPQAVRDAYVEAYRIGGLEMALQKLTDRKQSIERSREIVVGEPLMRRQAVEGPMVPRLEVDMDDRCIGGLHGDD